MPATHSTDEILRRLPGPVAVLGAARGGELGGLTAAWVTRVSQEPPLLLVAVGFSMFFISKREQIRQYGAMIMGLGLIFFGMSLMSGAMKPLRSYEPFLDLMGRMDHPLLAIGVAARCTEPPPSM